MHANSVSNSRRSVLDGAVPWLPRGTPRNLLEGRGRAEVHVSVHSGRDVPQGGSSRREQREERDGGGGGERGEAEGGPQGEGGPRGESRAEAIRAWLDRQGSSPTKSLIRLNASINRGTPLDDAGGEDRKSCGEELRIPRVPSSHPSFPTLLCLLLRAPTFF